MNFAPLYKNKVNGVHGGDGNLPTFNGFLKNQNYSDNDIAVSGSAAKETARNFWMKHTKWMFENVDQYDIDPIVTQGINQFMEAYTMIAERNAVVNSNIYKKVSAISGVNSTRKGSEDIDTNFPD